MPHTVQVQRHLHIKIQSAMGAIEHIQKTQIKTSAAHGITRFICTDTTAACDCIRVMVNSKAQTVCFMGVIAPLPLLAAPAW